MEALGSQRGATYMLNMSHFRIAGCKDTNEQQERKIRTA